MKRNYQSAATTADAPASLEVAAMTAGDLLQVTVKQGETEQKLAVTAVQAPNGDWLVEQGGIVRPVRLSRDRDVTWLSTAHPSDKLSGTTRWRRVEALRARHGHGEAQVRSPMTGRVVQVGVAAGDSVVKGQVLVVVEAMKMEHALKAPADAKVAKVLVKVGQQVDGGQELVELE